MAKVSKTSQARSTALKFPRIKGPNGEELTLISTKNIQIPKVQFKKSSGYNENKLGVCQWLHFTASAVPEIITAFDIIQLGHSGITKASVNELAGCIGISRKSLAEDILGVSVKTIERKGATEKLDKRTSSHVVEIARIVQQAYKVFEDEEKVKRWLNKENRALNNQKPVQLFDTLTGLNMVNDILGRIEEGVYL